MIDVHDVSSKLALISKSQRGYKDMLRRALSMVLQKNEDGDWLWGRFTARWEGMSSRVFEYKTFDAYLKKWCVFKLSELKDIYHDDAHLLPLLDEADAGKPGGQEGNQNASHGAKKTNVRNTNIRSGGSETKAYTLRRLKKQRLDIYKRVVSGELSANAAAIEAGFRKKPSPLDTLTRTWAKASDEERQSFLALISNSLPEPRNG